MRFASEAPDAPPPPVPRRRLRLPTALQPLLWADRKAVLGLAVLLLLAIAYAVQHFWLGRPQPVTVPTAGRPGPRAAPAGTAPAGTARDAEPADAADPDSGPDAGPDSEPDVAPHTKLPPVIIDVAGRVVHPGILTLPAGSRVADALRAAGGPQQGVDTDGLNLAQVLTDGEQILVGVPGQPVAVATSSRGPVSINHATVEQLDALPGIGPVLARHIIDFRTQHGAFRSLNQLQQISGIGTRKFAELKPLLTL
ncbi:helix-hairpin-helix domain-containing protein [Kitasatospora sp. NPDC058965]|uniref:helix-hairpin-helix domain-containing protein n=1 Tax=Kitasatospora sp. NPDC058965 TaxID=3346682 RepID=UPI0036C22555